MTRISTHPEDEARPGDLDGPNISPAGRLVRHERFLMGRAKRTLGRSRTGVASASDLAQEAWVAALEAERKGKGPAPTERAEAAWLWKILRNKVSEAFRKAKVAKRGGGLSVVPIEGDEIAGDGTSPSSRVLRATREESLTRAMDSLDPRHKDVLTLTFVEEFSRKQIAERLCVSERHVGNLYRDALERLREAYVAIEGPWEPS